MEWEPTYCQPNGKKVPARDAKIQSHAAITNVTVVVEQCHIMTDPRRPVSNLDQVLNSMTSIIDQREQPLDRDVGPIIVE